MKKPKINATLAMAVTYVALSYFRGFHLLTRNVEIRNSGALVAGIIWVAAPIWYPFFEAGEAVKARAEALSDAEERNRRSMPYRHAE